MRPLKQFYHLFFPTSEFEAFLSRPALAINRARLEHLGSLGLNLKNKKVLEVGAGIGLLTEFFERQGCETLSTDSRQENISELKRRFPHRKTAILDLEKSFDFDELGKFEIIFCYGTLYHLSKPDSTLKNLSKICTEMVLVETVLDLRSDETIRVVPERDSVTQASLKGCRPTRESVFKLLKKHFGYAYTTTTQPDYPDFILNWKNPPKQDFYRAIFVGSKRPLKCKTLLAYLPDKQRSYED